MRVAEVRKFCKLDEAGDSLVRAAMSQLNLSARGYHRVLKLARTIADLAWCDQIQPVHLAALTVCFAKALHTVPVLFGSTGRS
jgi:magnesium chelatase family protein